MPNKGAPKADRTINIKQGAEGGKAPPRRAAQKAAAVPSIFMQLGGGDTGGKAPHGGGGGVRGGRSNFADAGVSKFLQVHDGARSMRAHHAPAKAFTPAAATAVPVEGLSRRLCPVAPFKGVQAN